MLKMMLAPRAIADAAHFRAIDTIMRLRLRLHCCLMRAVTRSECYAKRQALQPRERAQAGGNGVSAAARQQRAIEAGGCARRMLARR